MSHSIKRLWKHSASLIILARNNAKNHSKTASNYKVLTLKRPPISTYPEAVCFPGGVTEHADHVEDWIRFYKQSGVNESELLSLVKTHTDRPFIFQNESNTAINRDISLRLTAIRETFEEVGILLCKKTDKLKNDSTSLAVTDFDVKYWQAEVFRDANNFRKLCEELKVVPDIWSLYEWSVWLTPTWRRLKRYETVFYIVGVNEQVNVSIKLDEVIHASWNSPKHLLESSKSGDIWLLPPQYYELSVLSGETDFDKVLETAKLRDRNLKTEFIFPIHYTVADGLIHCYPGDDFYPDKPDFEKTSHDVDKYVTKTCEQCRSLAKNLHRAEVKSLSDIELHKNVPSKL